MSIEIEQKYRVASHDPIAQTLKELGAEAGTRIEQEDLYLQHPSRDFRQSNEAFRLRRVGSRNFLTYKGPKHPGPTKTRDEIEIAFAEGDESAEQMHQLLRALGFDPVAVVRKVRTPYHLTFESRSLEVALDEVEAIGRFVEVETIVDDPVRLPAAQAAVIEVARRLGLVELEPRSYLRMVLEQGPARAPVDPIGSTPPSAALIKQSSTEHGVALGRG